MAPLVTSHDAWHVHKILGVAALAHFAYRAWSTSVTGCAFSDAEPVELHVCGVVVHLLLALSSLMFTLPQKRNYTAPMIWPEFRLHSIVFATRHTIATVANLLDAWPADPVAEIVFKTALVVGTVVAARFVSCRVGDPERRTTNAMPYPSTIDTLAQSAIKRNYVSAQFNATMQCVVGSPTAAFLPLLGIQIAPLLMTLVRKNIIDAKMYHRVYAAALYVPYAAAAVQLLSGTLDYYAFAWTGFIATKCVKPLRCSYKLRAELCWIVGVPLAIVGKWTIAATLGTAPAWLNTLGATGFVLTSHVNQLGGYTALL